ncbi:hypothetical protein PFISCL1PPCAC_7160, partial [Pristionchus fissidentatus]
FVGFSTKNLLIIQFHLLIHLLLFIRIREISVENEVVGLTLLFLLVFILIKIFSIRLHIALVVADFRIFFI